MTQKASTIRASLLNLETLHTQERYDRQALRYDKQMHLLERLWLSALRGRLWSRCPQGKMLEIGVGTGFNFPHHPRGTEVVGIDLSPRMLEQSRATAGRLGQRIPLFEMDIQDLAFPDASFDGVVGTFVFCSVPDPIQGLKEVWRVLKPGAPLLLLEHVRLPWLLGRAMALADPIAVGMCGAHINRDTAANVLKAGFYVDGNLSYFGGLVRLIMAYRPAPL